MGFLGKLLGGKNTAPSLDHDTLVEAGVCPNCWGKQAYEGKFKDYVIDQTKSNVNKDKTQQKAFIQQFVETNVTGIKLKSEGDKVHCPACNAKF